MTFRLHSRLIVWNILIIVLVSFLLAFVLPPSQLTLIVAASIVLTFVFSYGVRVLIGRPLHEIAVASQKLASGDLEQRLPATLSRAIARGVVRTS